MSCVQQRSKGEKNENKFNLPQATLFEVVCSADTLNTQSCSISSGIHLSRLPVLFSCFIFRTTLPTYGICNTVLFMQTALTFSSYQTTTGSLYPTIILFYSVIRLLENITIRLLFYTLRHFFK